MLLGINYNSFSGGESYLYYAEAAKKAGFDLVEVPTRIEGELPLGAGDKVYLGFRKSLDDIGIGIRSTFSGIFGRYPLTSPDRAIREQSAELVRRQLHAAAALGCDGTLVLLGPVTPEACYADAWKYGKLALARLAPLAESLGVSLCVENIWNNFLLSPLEMKGLIDEIGSPFVGCYFDIGNVVRTGYPEQWIDILERRVKKVHVKDYRRGAGTLEGFGRLGEGDVDFDRVMAALNRAGYTDSLIAELHNVPKDRPADDLLKETIADMKRLLPERREGQGTDTNRK